MKYLNMLMMLLCILIGILIGKSILLLVSCKYMYGTSVVDDSHVYILLTLLVFYFASVLIIRKLAP